MSQARAEVAAGRFRKGLSRFAKAVAAGEELDEPDRDLARTAAASALEQEEPGSAGWASAARLAAAAGVEEVARRVEVFETWRRGGAVEPLLAELPEATREVLELAIQAMGREPRALDPRRLRRQAKARLRGNVDLAGFLPDLFRLYALRRRGQGRAMRAPLRKALRSRPIAAAAAAAYLLGQNPQLLEALPASGMPSGRGVVLLELAKARSRPSGRSPAASERALPQKSAFFADYAHLFSGARRGAKGLRRWQAELEEAARRGDPRSLRATAEAAASAVRSGAERTGALQAHLESLEEALDGGDLPYAFGVACAAEALLRSPHLELRPATRRALAALVHEAAQHLGGLIGDPRALVETVLPVLNAAWRRLDEALDDRDALDEGLAAAEWLAAAGGPASGSSRGWTPFDDDDEDEEEEVCREGALLFRLLFGPRAPVGAARQALLDVPMRDEVAARLIARYPKEEVRLWLARGRMVDGARGALAEVERALGRDGAADAAVAALIEELVEALECQRRDEALLLGLGARRGRRASQTRSVLPEKALRQTVRRVADVADRCRLDTLMILLSGLRRAASPAILRDARRRLGPALAKKLTEPIAEGAPLLSRLCRLSAVFVTGDAKVRQVELRGVRRWVSQAGTNEARARAIWAVIAGLEPFRAAYPKQANEVGRWQVAFSRGVGAIEREVAWGPVVEALAVSPEKADEDLLRFCERSALLFPLEPVLTACRARRLLLEGGRRPKRLLQQARRELRARPVPGLREVLDRLPELCSAHQHEEETLRFVLDMLGSPGELEPEEQPEGCRTPF